jgi:hypothetical protein
MGTVAVVCDRPTHHGGRAHAVSGQAVIVAGLARGPPPTECRDGRTTVAMEVSPRDNAVTSGCTGVRRRGWTPDPEERRARTTVGAGRVRVSGDIG